MSAKRLYKGRRWLAFRHDTLIHDRQTELECIRKVLQSGCAAEVHTFANAVEDAGDPALALITRVMCAAQRRDTLTLWAFLETPEIDTVRSDPVLHYALALSLYWTAGLDAARPEIERLSRFDLGRLPERWRINARHLTALITAMGSEPAQVLCESDTEARFLDGQSLLVVLASVNGLPPSPFIVDTGAPTTVLSLDFVRRHDIAFDMEHFKYTRDTAGNMVRLYPAVINKLEVGDVAAIHCPIHVMRFSPALPVDGILSPLDLFRGQSVEFDLRSRVLRIGPAHRFQQWRHEVDSPLWRLELIWNEGSPYVPARLFSQSPCWCKLDTGAGANVLGLEIALTFGLDVASLQTSKTATAAGTADVYTGLMGPVAVGASPEMTTTFILKNCATAVDDTLFPVMGDALIGLPWFEGRRVIVAPDGREIHFTGPV